MIYSSDLSSSSLPTHQVLRYATFNKNGKAYLFLTLLTCFIFTNESKAVINNQEVDVISYSLHLELDIDNGYVVGKETIEFQIASEVASIRLSCGKLQIDNVTGRYVTGFHKSGRHLYIQLAQERGVNNEIIVNYHGSPENGLHFIPTLGQAYTVYDTSQWMICNHTPNDKARFSLNILLENDKTCVANGELITSTQEEGKTLYSWRQDYQAPAYTYGFVIGAFNSFEEKPAGVAFNYWSSDHTTGELQTIFRETPSMLRFFEERSGVKYYQTSYSQVLIGNYYQEMSGFSVLRDSYGAHILKDSTAINLISHELSHQWWGNQITCKSWNHFWLNEAFATYMSAAYNEHRFGRQKYDEDISSYFQVYSKVREEGKDKALVFNDWSNPSKSDRDLVYFKGAYVLHLLRQELGDEAFWQGVKLYSSKYFGKSVVTKDFQKVMETSSGKNLNAFFTQWVY